LIANQLVDKRTNILSVPDIVLALQMCGVSYNIFRFKFSDKLHKLLYLGPIETKVDTVFLRPEDSEMEKQEQQQPPSLQLLQSVSHQRTLMNIEQVPRIYCASQNEGLRW
jgi:hypothetical protein